MGPFVSINTGGWQGHINNFVRYMCGKHSVICGFYEDDFLAVGLLYKAPKTVTQPGSY